MRLALRNIVPPEYNRLAFQQIVDALQTQINGISEGVMAAQTNAQTTVPTTGDYAVGDFVAKSNPVEAGAAGSKYIITGWICTAVSPLTFKEARCLTGG